MSYAHHFGPLDGHVWLNTAHQGPLPRVAVDAAELALQQKVTPYLLEEEMWAETPRRLKDALGRVVNVPAGEVILGNSTAYGLNLLVQGLPLEEGDEVLLVDGDFPSTVITWLPLSDRGIEVRLFRPSSWPPTPDDFAREISDKTRVVCSSWVFSFFGSALDVEAVGALCRERGALFVLNGSQAVGARPLDLSSAPVDAVVSCGFKWLCGPYGTGFAWISPVILEDFRYHQAYWLAHGGARSAMYELEDDVGPAQFDVFGTANFLNFRSWTASVELLLSIGIEEIARHDDALVDQAVKGLDDLGYELISPSSGPARSTLVLFSHPDTGRNAGIFEGLAAEKVHIAEREGKLRIAPHLFNTDEDIARALEVLEKLR